MKMREEERIMVVKKWWANKDDYFTYRGCRVARVTPFRETEKAYGVYVHTTNSSGATKMFIPKSVVEKILTEHEVFDKVNSLNHEDMLRMAAKCQQAHYDEKFDTEARMMAEILVDLEIL